MNRLLLLLPLLLAACDADPADPVGDDDDAASGGVNIFELVPAPDSSDFFFRDDLTVEFTAAPDSATLVLVDAAGADVAGTTSWNASGSKMTFDPGSDLAPSSDYVATITWSPTDFEPFVLSFSTDVYGSPVADPSGLVGEVFSLDLAGATFIEPPGLGGVLGGLIDGVGVLFTLLPESDFAVGAQPGIQMMGALGVGEGQDIAQDACTATLDWTAGEDGVLGTLDDTPASFEDPFLRLGPADLNLTISGVSARLKEVNLVGVWHPDRRDFRGGEFEALIDTRGLDNLFEEGAEEGTICDLAAETLGVDCVDCGAPNPGAFCLFGRAVDVSAERIDGLALEAIACPDLIDRFNAGTCPIDELSSLDPDGDGVPTCP
jgi:hypothetical protein